MPTRSEKLTPTSAREPSLISSIAACIARPARTARSGSSSWATGAPNTRHDVVADVLVDRAAVAARPPAQAGAARGRRSTSRASGSMPLGDGRVAGEVGEQDRRLAPLLGQRATTGPPAAGLGGDPATEEPRALAARLRGRLRWGRGGRRRRRHGGRARTAQRECRTRCRTWRRAGSRRRTSGHLAASCAPQDMQKRAARGILGAAVRASLSSPRHERYVAGHARYVRIITRCARIGGLPAVRGGADRARRHPGQPVRAPRTSGNAVCVLWQDKLLPGSRVSDSARIAWPSRTLDARAPPWAPPFFGRPPSRSECPAPVGPGPAPSRGVPGSCRSMRAW